MSGLAARPGARRERIVSLLDIGAPARAPAGTSSPAASASASPIGRALLMRPRLLLLDEPLASLDARPQARDPALSGAAARRGQGADGLCQPPAPAKSSASRLAGGAARRTAASPPSAGSRCSTRQRRNSRYKAHSLSLKHNGAQHSVCSPPPCGEGLGVGVVRRGAIGASRKDPPSPSPPPQGGREQTEFAARTDPPHTNALWFIAHDQSNGDSRQLGAMPLSVSSLIAFSFFDRCASPIPRSTFGALVNWMLS